MGTELPTRLLVAVGGNAIHPPEIEGTAAEQVAIAAATGQALLPLLRLDNRVVITHGNGPVVGKVLLRQSLARSRVAPMSLDICVAHSQGGIAYVLAQGLQNALDAADVPRCVVSLITQVEVDPQHPAFRAPSKPVGFFLSEEEAAALHAELGWSVLPDAGRGWRVVVPSPPPRAILDLAVIRELVEHGHVVIAGGGGGIPVARRPDGTRYGIEAVVDKDLTSALLARTLDMDTLLILTGVSRVATDFGTPRQRDLDTVSVDALRGYRSEGHFAAGSMGPKVDAAIQFLEDGGRRAIIAHLDEALEALRGETGTHVVPNGG